MNNTKKIALAVATLCSAGTALAQEINPSWYVQPSVVYVETDADYGVDEEKDWGGGLKFGKPLHRYWDVQVGATHMRTDSGQADYRQTLFGADALLMLSRQNFRPFLLVGLGVARDKVSNPLRNQSKNNPYITAGLGFQVGLNERWSLQADYRAVRADLDTEDYGVTRGTNKYLTLALNYAFNPPPSPPPAPTPAPTPAPPPAPEVIIETPPPVKFEKITLSATELFGFDNATLTMPQPKLDEIAAVLVANPNLTDIDVVGYTDRLGKEKYNQKLSERRANAVRDYLVSKGVEGNRLKAIGRGEENPVVECNQKKRSELIACLAPNRRVEVEQITIEKRVQ